MAEDTGFEPVITESKSAALGQTKLIPNKIVILFSVIHRFVNKVASSDKRMAVMLGPFPRTVRPE